MEDLSENENTVAVLTIYYKEKQLTNLVLKGVKWLINLLILCNNY